MTVTRRIYVSLPADHWLPKEMNDLKWGSSRRSKILVTRQRFSRTQRGSRASRPQERGARGMPTKSPAVVWERPSLEWLGGILRIARGDRRGFPPNSTTTKARLRARSACRPWSSSRQDVMRRVVFDPTFGGFVGEIPPEAGPEWLKTEQFRVPFGYWRMQLYARRDVFLGYCSSSRTTASSLKNFLQSTGATVLDWQTDFIAGRSILAQIEEAASRCNAGIFLFTKDDDLIDKGQPDTGRRSSRLLIEIESCEDTLSFTR